MKIKKEGQEDCCRRHRRRRGHRNNRHYRVRRPNSRACPSLRPNVACYLGTGLNPRPLFRLSKPRRPPRRAAPTAT